MFSVEAAAERGEDPIQVQIGRVGVGVPQPQRFRGPVAGQLREVIARLRQAGQWADGDPPVLIVTDAGYDVVRLAWLLRDLPVQLLGRVRSDRVFYAPAGGYAGTGRPGRHGPAVKLSDAASWPSALRWRKSRSTWASCL